MKNNKNASIIMAKNVNYQIIKDYLKKNGISVVKFSYKCGISNSTFYRIISGKSNVTRKNIFRIALGMKVEPIELIRSDLE